MSDSASSLTLYQFDTCPFCWKVKALLNYTGQHYQSVEVTPFSMKELDFTDHKKVPVLKDGDQVITESAEIVAYINTHYSKLGTPEATNTWSPWIDEQLARYLPILIHPGFATSYRHLAVTLSGIRINPFKKILLRFAGALIMPRVAKKMMAKYNIAQPREAFLSSIDHWVEKGLHGKAFHGDGRPDFIDCSVFGVLYSSHNLGVVDMAKSHNEAFSRWYDACLPMMSQNRS